MHSRREFIKTCLSMICAAYAAPIISCNRANQEEHNWAFLEEQQQTGEGKPIGPKMTRTEMEQALNITITNDMLPEATWQMHALTPQDKSLEQHVRRALHFLEEEIEVRTGINIENPRGDENGYQNTIFPSQGTYLQQQARTQQGRKIAIVTRDIKIKADSITYMTSPEDWYGIINPGQQALRTPFEVALWALTAEKRYEHAKQAGAREARQTGTALCTGLSHMMAWKYVHKFNTPNGEKIIMDQAGIPDDTDHAKTAQAFEKMKKKTAKEAFEAYMNSPEGFSSTYLA